MVNENRAHAYDGMDRAGHTTSTPEGPRDGGSLTIGELARDAGVTLRALRFYQSKGLLTPRRNGSARLFSHDDRERLALILQGKRLGFTLMKFAKCLPHAHAVAPRLCRSIGASASSRSICWSASGATSRERWPNCGKSTRRCLLPLTFLRRLQRFPALNIGVNRLRHNDVPP